MDVLGSKKQTTTLYTDEDLFFLMSLKDEDEAEAQEAFRIFYEKQKVIVVPMLFRLQQIRYF